MESNTMRIPNDVLDEAYERFRVHQAKSWGYKGIRELVSFVVENSIDYEAMAKQYADWHGVDWTDDDEMEACRRRVRVLAALGIGGYR